LRAASLSNEWQRIGRQLKVDQVHLEAQRNRTLATDREPETVKKFVVARGVEVAGALAFPPATIPARGSSSRFATRIRRIGRSSGRRSNWRPGISTKSSRTISFS
jgi:hypothetical protein